MPHQLKTSTQNRALRLKISLDSSFDSLLARMVSRTPSNSSWGKGTGLHKHLRMLVPFPLRLAPVETESSVLETSAKSLSL